MIIVKNNIFAVGLFSVLGLSLGFLASVFVSLGEQFYQFGYILVLVHTLIAMSLYYICGKKIIKADDLSIALRFLSTISVIIILCLSVLLDTKSIPLWILPFYPTGILIERFLEVHGVTLKCILATLAYLPFFFGVIRQERTSTMSL